MTVHHLFVNGAPVRLGKRIGKGGEGEVYLLADDPTRALKLYTVHDVMTREAKIKAFVGLRLAEKSKLIAFPIAIASDRHGEFKGFVMNFVREHQPLFELYSPGSRKQKFPQASYKFVVRAALNVARAVAVAHEHGCVIGDINHSGILVSPNATAALIDADSFQIQDGGQHFLCRVGVPEYTPPELQHTKLSSTVRTPDHDAFGLAVVLFQLLAMGRHPFVGSYAKGDMPMDKAIAEHRFTYSRRRAVGMTPPPGACTLQDFPQSIADAFELAFSSDRRSARPTAKQWVNEIESLEKSLVACGATKLHHYSRMAAECPWCRMEKRLGVVLFIPTYSDYSTATSQLNSNDFNLSEIWAHIEAVRLPPRTALTPKLPVVNAPPSAQALHAKRDGHRPNRVRTLALVAAGIIFVAAPGMWFLSAIIIAGGYFYANNLKDDLSNQYLQQVRAVDAELSKALQDWARRCGIDRLDEMKDRLKEDRQTYLNLKQDEDERIANYKAHRQEHQLGVYLDRFRIRDFKIHGIGPAKLATLASYGIETAADITLERVRAVPGFGPTNSQPLLDWQSKFKKNFVYNAQPTPTDRAELGKIYLETQQRAQRLRDQISSQAKAYLQAAQACTAMLATADPLLKSLHERRAQYEADCTLLGIALPTRPSQSASLTSVTRPSTRAVTSSSVPTRTVHSTASPPQCPQCKSRMIQRMARRGRRSGRAFWGCSRYPSCRGTRPI